MLDSEIDELLKRIKPNTLKEHRFKTNGNIKYKNNENESDSLISLVLIEDGNSSKRKTEQLSLFFRTKQDYDQFNQHRINNTKWLARYDRGLWELYLAVKALKNASHLIRIKQKFNEIQLCKQKPFSFRLNEVEYLVDEIIFSGSPMSSDQYLDILDTIASWVAQIILGTGYSKTGDAILNKGQISKFFKKIEKAQMVLLEGGSSSYEDRLKFFKLVSIHTDEKDFLNIEKKIETLNLESIYKLLAIWSCTHDFCEQLSTEITYKDKQKDKSYKEKWKKIAEYSLPKLANLLSDQYQENLSPEWLHLWFCYVLLEKVVKDENWNKRPVHPTEKWRFRASISYIFREGLRFWEFGEELEYVFQPDVYATSLKTLVEHHAHWVVRLSRDYDLRILLTEIGNARDPDEFQYAIGHLHHALQIYIVGHFICSLNINSLDKTNSK